MAEEQLVMHALHETLIDVLHMRYISKSSFTTWIDRYKICISVKHHEQLQLCMHAFACMHAKVYI